MREAIKVELDRLKARSPNGLLTVGVVLEAARLKTNPLHDWPGFTWDAREALKKNLESEARELIREYMVVIVTPSGPVRTRHFVSLASDRVIGGGYRLISEVLDDEAMSAQLLADALAELESFQVRYRRLQELVGVFREIDAVRERHPPQRAKQQPRGKRGGEDGRRAA
jgi:hypothetical protein